MFGKRKRTQILVVGAGPVGLMTALVLRRHGLDVSVVDQAWRAAGRSYAAALHPSSLSLLDELGLAGEVLHAAQRIHGVALFDGAGRRAEVAFRELASPFPFVAVLPQSTLESLLERELERRGVSVAWLHRAAGMQQTGSRVVTEVEVLEAVPSGYAVATTSVEVAKTLAIESDFAVGADGHRSTVRRDLEIEYESWGEPQLYDIFEFESEPMDAAEVCVTLDASTASVLWTLPNGRQRFSFQVNDPARRADREREKSRLDLAVPGEVSPRYSAEVLARTIRERAAWYTAKLGDVAWGGEARFEQRLAKRLGVGRAWLVGDAAHQTGPIGVQSMNRGLLEANQLAAAIADAASSAGAMTALESYQGACERAWRGLLGGEQAIRSSERASSWVAQNAARILPCLPGSGDELSQMAGQLGLSLA